MEERQEKSAGGVIGWVKRHPKTVAGLLIVAVAGATLFTFNSAYKNLVARKIAAIRERGEPVSLDDVNARQPILNDSDNLTTAIITAMKPLAWVSSRAGAVKVPNVLPFFGTQPIPGILDPIPADAMAAMEKFLKENASLLEALDRAVHLDQGLCRFSLSDNQFNMSIVGAGEILAAMRLECLRIYFLVETGDCDGAAAELRRMNHCIHSLDGAYLPTSAALARLSAIARSENAILRVLNRCELSAEDLAELRVQLATTHKLADLHETLLVERAMTIDGMDSLTLGIPATSATGGSGRVVVKRIPIFPYLDAALTLDYFAAYLEVASLPVDQQISALDAMQTKLGPIPEYAVMCRAFCPSLSYFFVLNALQTAQTRTLDAIIACEAFRLKNNRWPENLDELAPEFLEAVPIDPFDGKPLRFAIKPNGVQVWSIGKNRLDLDGDLGPNGLTPNAKQGGDTGVAILNPELRKSPAQP